MTLRNLLVAVTLMLLPGYATAAPDAKPDPLLANAAPMVFYIARGAPDACGPGCDSWIAVEGKIDGAAAGRFRKFMRAQKDHHLPLYFASPGGNLEQALEIGRLLHERPAVARIGQTVVKECGGEPQAGEACLKIKQSGRVLDAELSVRGGACNSACPYLILGASQREIAPNASMAIHSPKITLIYRGAKPPENLRVAAMQKARERSHQMVATYLAKMGIDRGLLDLAETVKFESRHVLTRDEIVRFGIDRRNFVETAWRFDGVNRSRVSKFAIARKSDGATYRTMSWQLFCEGTDRARLMFIRESDRNAAGTTTVALVAGSQPPPVFGATPARRGPYEVWTAAMTPEAVKHLFEVPRLEAGERTQLPDGKTTEAMFEIATDGLERAWTDLAATCAAAPGSAAHTIEMPMVPNASASAGR
jgi:hypothetical protein